MSVTYTSTHRNARSLTHWARLGFEPMSSWLLVRLDSVEPWPELLLLSSFWRSYCYWNAHSLKLLWSLSKKLGCFGLSCVWLKSRLLHKLSCGSFDWLGITVFFWGMKKQRELWGNREAPSHMCWNLILHSFYRQRQEEGGADGQLLRVTSDVFGVVLLLLSSCSYYSLHYGSVNWETSCWEGIAER